MIAGARFRNGTRFFLENFEKKTPSFWSATVLFCYSDGTQTRHPMALVSMHAELDFFPLSP